MPDASNKSGKGKDGDSKDNNLMSKLKDAVSSMLSKSPSKPSEAKPGDKTQKGSNDKKDGNKSTEPGQGTPESTTQGKHSPPPSSRVPSAWLLRELLVVRVPLEACVRRVAHGLSIRLRIRIFFMVEPLLNSCAVILLSRFAMLANAPRSAAMPCALLWCSRRRRPAICPQIRSLSFSIWRSWRPKRLPREARGAAR